MPIRSALLSAALGTAVLFSAATDTPAEPGYGHALLLLYDSRQSAALVQVLPALERQGCGLWQQGAVAARQGNLDLGAARRATLLRCDHPVLSDHGRRAELAPLMSEDDSLRVLEGPLVADVAPGAGAYILKISRYNNRDLDGRARDLAEINGTASERSDAWVTEATVEGLRAYGMETPDEIVVIRYGDPAQGARFRENNPDILQAIGAFNKTHLAAFTYLSLAPAE